MVLMPEVIGLLRPTSWSELKTAMVIRSECTRNSSVGGEQDVSVAETDNQLVIPMVVNSLLVHRISTELLAGNLQSAIKPRGRLSIPICAPRYYHVEYFKH